ncbi:MULTISPECIES: hypothetical protein [Shewanella]|uniref:DUF8180 domain-containing protein n=1 Tax=Shewanella fodinae TaxID=552357 RepID=A0A4R2F4B3_9GAMM|nr:MULTISPECIES: hypothetical protein [Shewanella]MBO1273492.1 hypothetical protein [Shewanella sp. 4t3-1-2LB]TCN77006.1 hypothetical protein EDC91_14913 [Shewanella fodinae]
MSHHTHHHDHESLSLEQRLQVLLPHWHSHNQEHIVQLQQWQQQAVALELLELSESLDQAVYNMQCAGEQLQQALALLTDHNTKTL